MPIDITITSGGQTETHVIWHEADIEWYVLPAHGTVTSVQFDKDTWILRGAATNVPYESGSPQLIAAVPTLGGRALGASELALRFSKDVTYVDADLSVTGSQSGAHAFTSGYNAVNNEITLSFGGALPSGETWTVHVSDDLRGQDNSAQLDGEIADPTEPGSLPSGDGLPGGDAVFAFFSTTPGDFDFDGDSDLSDFGHFQACYSGPNTPQNDSNCQDAKFDGDEDVDLDDFGIMQGCLSGAGIPADPNCAS